MNKKIGSIYFGILGAITLAFGVIDLVVAIGSDGFSFGVLEIPGDVFRGIWGGLIVLFAGLFYLSGVKNIFSINQFSKVVMGSVLIWIIAGCDIFGRITESIPGGEDGPWFNTLEGFLGTYAPPYPPAIFLLPFSLVAIYYIRRRRTIQ